MMNSGYLHKIRDSAQIEDSGRIGNNTTFYNNLFHSESFFRFIYCIFILKICNKLLSLHQNQKRPMMNQTLQLHNANLFLAGIPTFCKSCCVHVHWFSGFI